jgi:F-type H+-transporting ATPase subunit b
MPQIEQLPFIFFSQLFWLAVVFGIIYFGIARGMVPKIRSVVDDRDEKIADDLAAAQRAREGAEAAEAVYRERIETSRSEALKVAQQAKQDSALETEKRLKVIDEQIGARAAEAEARIRAAANEARRELEPVAAEAASQLVSKLTGQKVSASEAQPTVKALLHG